MRQRCGMACAAAFYVFSLVQGALGATPQDDCDLPSGLRAEISTTYPNTRVVSLRDLNTHDRELFQRDHGNRCPGRVKVDFRGDGKPTWALVLLRGEDSKRRANLILARQRNKSWEIQALDMVDASPAPVVWRERPGKYDDVYGQKSIRATRPVIVLCAYEGWAILYAWTGERVEKIWISD